MCLSNKNFTIYKNVTFIHICIIFHVMFLFLRHTVPFNADIVVNLNKILVWSNITTPDRLQYWYQRMDNYIPMVFTLKLQFIPPICKCLFDMISGTLLVTVVWVSYIIIMCEVRRWKKRWLYHSHIILSLWNSNCYWSEFCIRLKVHQLFWDASLGWNWSLMISWSEWALEKELN